MSLAMAENTQIPDHISEPPLSAIRNNMSHDHQDGEPFKFDGEDHHAFPEHHDTAGFHTQ